MKNVDVSFLAVAVLLSTGISDGYAQTATGAFTLLNNSVPVVSPPQDPKIDEYKKYVNFGKVNFGVSRISDCYAVDDPSGAPSLILVIHGDGEGESQLCYSVPKRKTR